MSRPTRACELKSNSLNETYKGILSRPTRACELKSVETMSIVKFDCHALHGRVS